MSPGGWSLGWIRRNRRRRLACAARPRHSSLTRPSRAIFSRPFDRFSTGSGGAPALAPNIVILAIQGWLRGSIDLGASRVRSGHLPLALLGDETLSRAVREEAGQFARIPAEDLKRDFAVATEGSSQRRAVALVAAAVRK
jgi:type VI secretion system protein VasG